MKSSSAVGFAVAERGRSSFATSVARAMKVESGRVMPRVDWMRCWTSSTFLSEIETATSVSGSGSAAAEAFEEAAGEGIALGGASVILLRSRWLRFDIRADRFEG